MNAYASGDKHNNLREIGKLPSINGVLLWNGCMTINYFAGTEFYQDLRPMIQKNQDTEKVD